MEITRRNALAAGGSLLAANALSLTANADQGANGGDTLYSHGLVWNRDLPGILGELKISFDMRINLETGKGFGTAQDPSHPDYNLHFSVESVATEKRPRGETRFTMSGVTTASTEPGNVGLPVKIVAEIVGEMTVVGIRIGENTFAGSGSSMVEYAILLAVLILAAK